MICAFVELSLKQVHSLFRVGFLWLKSLQRFEIQGEENTKRCKQASAYFGIEAVRASGWTSAVHRKRFHLSMGNMQNRSPGVS